jgi:hypothetical protein
MTDQVVNPYVLAQAFEIVKVASLRSGNERAHRGHGGSGGRGAEEDRRGG